MLIQLRPSWGTALLTLALLLGIGTPTRAEWPADWVYFQRERGWRFYNEERPEKEAAPAERPDPPAKPAVPDWEEPLRPGEEPKPVEPEIPTEGKALEEWLRHVPDAEIARLVKTVPAAAIRAWIPVLMDHALTTLDRSSVRKYLLVQQESMRRSDRFTRIWQEVIWTDPVFDRPGAMPTGSLAQSLYEEEKGTQQKQGLQALRETVSLLLVVRPNCRSCEIAWKVAKEWADQYQFTIRPVAGELTTLADGTAVLPYPQIVESLQVLEYPSLYLLQPHTHYITRLGTGILSEEEIATRVLRLIPDANPEGALIHDASVPDLSPAPVPAP